MINNACDVIKVATSCQRLQWLRPGAGTPERIAKLRSSAGAIAIAPVPWRNIDVSADQFTSPADRIELCTSDGHAHLSCMCSQRERTSSRGIAQTLDRTATLRISFATCLRALKQDPSEQHDSRE